jgi:hypothetical protein
MSYVSNIVAPVIQGVFYVLFFGGLCFFAVRFLRKKNPNFFLFIKYKIFRKKWDDEAVAWCMDAISKDYDVVGVEKKLLIGGHSKKRIKERLYVFQNVQRRLQKGGGTDEQFRQSNSEHEIKEIPNKKG